MDIRSETLVLRCPRFGYKCGASTSTTTGPFKYN